MKKGVPLKGKRGKWLPVIIEYKCGKPKKDTRDIVQLVAQTICLEETLECAIDYGYLYYHSINQKNTFSGFTSFPLPSSET